MRCKPLRWLLGLPGLALLAAIALLGELPHIGVDLRDRANLVLQSAGFDWAKLDFDARDVRIYGTASDEREQQAALDAVRNTCGIRIANDEISLIQALRPYLWSMTRDGTKIQVDGFADSTANRKAVASAADSQMRGSTLQQNVKLARGMPAREDWLAAIEYTSSLMAGLKKGKAGLQDLGLSISGEAASPLSYALIQRTLSGQRPAGLKLVSVDITPPVVKPYTWSASWQNHGVIFDGYVADEAGRKALLETADGLFPGATVNDHMLPAGGEPADFRQAQQLALRDLAQLESGKAALKDTDADLRGVAVEQDTAEAVTKTFHGGVPSGYRASESITFRKAHLAVAKPYVWSAELSGKDLKLEGFVPDDATRNDIAALAAQRFPQARITDRTVKAAGLPSGFAAAAAAGLSGLARLDRGKTHVIDTDIDLTGHTTDKTAATATQTVFEAAVPSNFSHSTNLTYDLAKAAEPPKPVEPPKPPKVVEAPKPAKVEEQPKPATQPSAPYVWDAVVDNGNITLTGTVPSNDARDLLLRLIAGRLPGINIIDNLSIGGRLPSSDDDWLRSLDAGLKAIADLGSGHAHLADRTLKVSGVTRDKAMPDFITESLRRGVAAGYGSEASIEYQEPPAYVTSFKYDGLRVILEGEVPTAAAKSKLMAQLKPLFPDRDFEDRTQVKSGAPDGWQEALTTGLGPLSQLDAGQLTLRGRTVLLSGTTEDEKILDGARKKISASLPRGFAGTDLLTYVAPPVPDPKLLAQKQDESKYDVKKLITQSSELSAPECQAVLNSVIRGKAFFGSGKTNLDGRATAVLDSIVSMTKRCPNTHVEIAGHTDSDGAAAFNQRLSERRALSVVGYLHAKGVDESRMRAVGYGEAKPIAPNDNAANKARNRRIDFSVTQAKG